MRCILHIKISIEHAPSQTEKFLSVSDLSTGKISIVHLRCVGSQSLESFPLFDSKIIGKDAQCRSHFLHNRVVQATVFLRLHSEFGEKGSQLHHFRCPVDQTNRLAL